MKFSYEYEELIQELEEELSDKTLSITDNIQILRAEKPVFQLYRPIIDWYYDDKKMTEICTDVQEVEEIKSLKKQYSQDKHLLEIITVSMCLEEMKELNNIL